ADPIERERMGNAGRLRVGSEFTLERMAQRFETVYHEALGRDEWSATAQPALT
ncbi:MAG: glycosyl transferase, partial [Armatimonadota bacterium]